MEEPNWMYQNSLLSAFKKISVRGKYRIVGSNATRGSIYSSDYDLNSKIEKGVDLLEHVQNLFKNPKDFIICDFKTGDLHWSREQVLSGKHGKILLEDELKKESNFIKIDFAIVTAGGLAECSEVYYYKKTSKKDTIKQLEADIDLYLETDSMKSLKRLVSILK